MEKLLNNTKHKQLFFLFFLVSVLQKSIISWIQEENKDVIKKWVSSQS